MPALVADEAPTALVAVAEAPRAPLLLDKASRFAAAALGASLSLAIVDDDDDGAVQELYAANGLRAFEADDDRLTAASCDRDDFREIWGGKTMRNRHRHAW